MKSILLSLVTLSCALFWLIFSTTVHPFIDIALLITGIGGVVLIGTLPIALFLNFNKTPSKNRDTTFFVAAFLLTTSTILTPLVLHKAYSNQMNAYKITFKSVGRFTAELRGAAYTDNMEKLNKKLASGKVPLPQSAFSNSSFKVSKAGNLYIVTPLYTTCYWYPLRELGHCEYFVSDKILNSPRPKRKKLFDDLPEHIQKKMDKLELEKPTSDE